MTPARFAAMAERVTVRRDTPARIPNTRPWWNVYRDGKPVGDVIGNACGTFQVMVYRPTFGLRILRRVRTVAAGVRWIVAHAR